MLLNKRFNQTVSVEVYAWPKATWLFNFFLYLCCIIAFVHISTMFCAVQRM